MKKTIFALLAGAAMTVAAGSASAATLIGSYWVGGGTYWGTGYPQTAYSPLDAAVLLFGPGSYAISIYSTSVTHTGWTDGFGTAEHLKVNWDGGGGPGTPVAETFIGGATYAGSGDYSAYICDRECLLGEGVTSPNAAINYVFAAVPEPATWGLMIAGFGMVGASMRRRQGMLTA